MQEKKGAYEFMKYFTTPENQAKWSMETGYVAVRKSTQDVKEFKDYTKKNPQALVPLQQASHGSVLPTDPTGGKIYDALKVQLTKLKQRECLPKMHLTRHRRQQKMQWLLYLTNLNRKIRLYLRRNAVIKGILFDKDGTLLKFDELWNEATKKCCSRFFK